jgi:hypothetical protein
MQLKEMVLAILNESELVLSDDAVQQIVDQVQCIKINPLLSSHPVGLLGPNFSPRATKCTVAHLFGSAPDFFTGPGSFQHFIYNFLWFSFYLRYKHPHRKAASQHMEV